MSLSTLALSCFEGSNFFAQDILNIKIAVHDLNKNRQECGEYRKLYDELRQYPEKFWEYTRMSTDTFDYILHVIDPVLMKKHTNFHPCIETAEKLLLTLRFLSTGASFKSLSHTFRLGRSTIAKCIYQTLKAIWITLQPHHMPQPTMQHLQRITQTFYDKFQYPNCIGAIDGKHFRIKKPPTSGSNYFNYKKFFSLILQAVADADYKFVTIEVGGRGRQSDGGTFHYSKLNQLLQNRNFNIPPPQRLPGSNMILPNVLIGDEGYPLKSYLMRPYPGNNLDVTKRTFNKRLSRARVCVECAFGILTSKWRIFLKPIETNIKHCRLIIKTSCLLHNIVRDRDGSNDLHYRTALENLDDNNQNVRRTRANNRATTQAKLIRHRFKNYFNNE